MCDTVEDEKARKPAWEQFGLYKGRSNNVRLTQFSLPRQSYLVTLDTISHLFCNEADYLRKRKQLKLPCLLVGHHFRYHQALLDHPNKNISGYSGYSHLDQSQNDNDENETIPYFTFSEILKLIPLYWRPHFLCLP